MNFQPLLLLWQKNGRIVAAGAVDVRKAGTNIPVTINYRFHIGSHTKAFTVLLAAILNELFHAHM